MGRGENNNLQIWGNKESMNLNSMILTNIQSSTYYKTKLTELTTYHEVVDEIYYRVTHMEPWEKGSRRTQGLTGMCGGVRGVGGGGIVSSCFCLLYKLYTLKLTRKQVIGLMTHVDSPYIRGLGFMYVRYTQNPADLFHWYCDFLDDEEEIDVKAGGGMVMRIGQMLRHWLVRLDWFDTLFPRIPVPIQKEILDGLREIYGNRVDSPAFVDLFTKAPGNQLKASEEDEEEEEAEQQVARRSRSVSGSRRRSRSRSRSRHRRSSKERHRSRSRENGGGEPSKRPRSRSRDSESRHRRHHRHKHHKKHHNRSRSRTRSRSSSRHRHHHHKHKKSERRRTSSASSNE